MKIVLKMMNKSEEEDEERELISCCWLTAR